MKWTHKTRYAGLLTTLVAVAVLLAACADYETDAPAKPDVWLKDMEYYTASQDLFYSSETDQDSLGEMHYNAVSGSFRRVYKLDGAYSSLVGVFYQRAGFSPVSAETSLASFEVRADGQLLYTSKIADVDPIAFDLSLTGVQELAVHFHSLYSGDRFMQHLAALGDCGFYR